MLICQSVSPPLPTPRRLGAMSPSRYLRLRRLAAGLSVAQIAASLASERARRADAIDLIQTLESPGSVARHRETIERFAAIVPLDADTYFQLADRTASPPTLCAECGCSPALPCMSADGHEHCSIDAGACSACSPARTITQ